MSAQLEDGYTRTANELLDHLMKSKLNGTQHSIIYCIIRNTYGFQRKSHAMSLSYISKAIDSHKDLVKRDLDKLIEWNIVRVFKEATFNDPREIGMNNKVGDWIVQSEPKSRQSANKSTVSQSVAEQSTNQSTPTVDQLVYQERKSFKEIKEIHTTKENFEKVSKAYAEIHKVLELPYSNGPLLSSMLDEGIPPEHIIGVIKEKFKDGIKTLKFYEGAIRDSWYVPTHSNGPRLVTSYTPPPKKTGIPDLAETQAQIDEITRLQEAKRKRIAERDIS